MKRGKKYIEALKKIEKDKLYTVDEAVKVLKELDITKFDPSIDIAIKLNIDPRKADQQVRGTLSLPHGTGKVKKVLVLAKGDALKEAKEAKADYFGEEEMIDKIKNENFFDFDIIVATPEMMPKLGAIAKILGPKGLMPNPKVGTVTNEVLKTVNNIKNGQVSYKADSFGIVHGVVGKKSFSEDKLNENINTYIDAIKKTKASTVKGEYVKSITLSSTMSPSIKIKIN